METKAFTLIIYTENNIGILNRISSIFLRRHINIESFTTSVSELEEVYKFVIVVNTDEPMVVKIVGQIEKQIDVIKAFYYTDHDTIYQETALYKMSTDLFFDQKQVQNIVRDSGGTFIYASRDICVIEKTGRRPEIESLYNALKPYGVMQFVRSGRISVSKPEMKVSSILKNFKK